MMMHIEQSQKLYEKAKDLMPGGVNSPVRAFLSVGAHPGLFSAPRISICTMRTETPISTILVPGGR